VTGAVLGRPTIDLKAEQRMQRFLREATDRNLVKSMHDVSSGGLAVALAESCIAGDVGCEMIVQGERDDVNMFGELGGIVVSTDRFDELEELATRHQVVVAIDGEVRGSRLIIGGRHSPRATSLTLDELRDAHESGLPRALEAPPVAV
jgi:phosphoribosylformylglycinamidine synthase